MDLSDKKNVKFINTLICELCEQDAISILKIFDPRSTGTTLEKLYEKQALIEADPESDPEYELKIEKIEKDINSLRSYKDRYIIEKEIERQSVDFSTLNIQMDSVAESNFMPLDVSLAFLEKEKLGDPDEYDWLRERSVEIFYSSIGKRRKCRNRLPNN